MKIFSGNQIENDFLKNAFIIKKVFPRGELGRLVLDDTLYVVESKGLLVERLGYVINSSILGKSIFDVFAEKEKMRLKYLFKQIDFECLIILSYLQLRHINRGNKWTSICVKKEILPEGNSGFTVVFLDEEEGFTSLATDKFDVLCKAFFDMYEADLAQIGHVLRDDMAQELYALRVSLQNFIILNGYENEINTIKNGLNQVISKISRLSNDLLPSNFHQLGFLSAVEDLVFSVRRGGYNLRYRIDQQIVDKSPEFQFCCYRVIQKLLLIRRENEAQYDSSLIVSVKKSKINISLIEYKSLDKGLFIHYTESELNSIRSRIAIYEGLLEVSRIENNSQVLITMYN